MIDPVLSLAVSMHANPGVYALLLGSGLSSSAGIPTGWGIVEDLTDKLALAAGEEIAPGQTRDGWFRDHFGTDAAYSSLLDELAATRSERQALLRGYFEPTAEEREEGRKLPTRAHRAIARLCANGRVRVIVTTNFDQLMEIALRDLGINPVVIATPDAAKGAPPLQHSPVVVVKINGDYLDTRILNTVAELNSYAPAMTRLLSGWSGDWDNALRALIERAGGRRYGLFWAMRSAPGLRAEALLSLKQGKRITGDAETFFTELADKVEALAFVEQQHPLAPDVAVARLKRALAEPAKGRIAAHDLVSGEVEAAAASIVDAKTFPSMEDVSLLVQRLKRYEAMMSTLVSLAATGISWGDQLHDRIWIAALERLTNVRRPSGGYELWYDLRRYPALYLLYAAGVTAVARHEYAKLASLLNKPRFENDAGVRFPLGSRLYPNAVLALNTARALGSQHAPFSVWICDALRPPLRPVTPRDEDYQEAFDSFELLLSLFNRADDAYPRFTGCFAWRDADHGYRDALAIAHAEIQAQGAKWWPFSSGILPAASVNKVVQQLETAHQRFAEAGWRSR
jgi:hypothetical protein